MRIAILTNEYPPHIYGGAGVHAHFLSEELAAMDGGRHLIKVLCFGSKGVRRQSHGAGYEGRISPFPFKEPRICGSFRHLPERAHDRHATGGGHLRPPHLVHAPGRLSPQTGCGKSSVACHASRASLHRPRKEERVGAGYPVSTLDRNRLRNADGVIAVSRWMPDDDVKELYGVPSRKSAGPSTTGSTWRSINPPITPKFWPGTG